METPSLSDMADENKCFTCGDNTRRLSPLNGQKICSDPGNISTILNFLDLSVQRSEIELLFMCDPCFKKIISFCEYQTSSRMHALSILKEITTKRLATTPKGNKSKRQRVVNMLISSVEKLKIREREQIINQEINVTPHVSELDHCYVKDNCILKDSICRAKKVLFSVDQNSNTDKSSVLAPLCMPSNEFYNEHVEHAYVKESVVLNKNPAMPKATHELRPHKEYYHLITSMENVVQKLSVPGTSILSKTLPENLMGTNIFEEASSELQSKCEFLFDTLSAALGQKISDTSKTATIATLYGIILHCRNNRTSAIQRLFTTAAIRYHADNKQSIKKAERDMHLLGLLNKVHITLSDNSKAKLLDSYADHWEDKLLKTISSGKDGKINGDNLDIRVETNDVRMNNKSKDYHFFASDWIADRVDINHLDDDHPVADIDEACLNNFLPSSEEMDDFKKWLKILLGRKISNNMKGFQWMKKVIPTHIPHDLQEAMSTKSDIYMLPILLQNEACYADCITILHEYVANVNRWYAKAGRGGELDHLQVPVGGDQLTRVRLQGAKALRQGAHTNVERFDQLQPFIVEMFHTVQDFLEKLCKKFLKLDQATDKATLAHLKMIIQRNNINGKVKVRFKAHEQFIDTVGTSYLLSLAMNIFGMQDVNDVPKHPDIPENINMVHTERKTAAFNAVMDHILDATFIPPLSSDTKNSNPARMIVKVKSNGEEVQHVLSVQNDHLKIPVFDSQKRRCVICVSASMARRGCTLRLRNFDNPIVITGDTAPSDDLHNYVVNFLNWYFLILSLQEAISEGNIYQTNIVLKFMMPVFYSNSALSKYMTECIDYILKTEIMLTPKMALKVRAASFVNPTGRTGHNKAADMEKENQVKLLKDLIKGLGSNKTEKSIIQISKVTPVIHSIVENLTEMTSTKIMHTSHQPRPSDEDIQQVLKVLQNNNPWNFMPGRLLKGFKGISKTPYDFDHSIFETCVMNNVERLRRGLITPLAEDDESEKDE